MNFIRWNDWTWWAWALTATLLAVGVGGYPIAFWAAMGVTTLQAMAMFVREKKLRAFPVQLRIAYLMLLAICFIPQMHWLYWLPTVGTFAMVIFGYCLLGRTLSLLPWNRQQPLSARLLCDTFISRPCQLACSAS